MKVKLKAQYPCNKLIPSNLRGRTYDIGTINCSVFLTDDGLTLQITNNELSEKLKKLLGDKK